MKRIVLTLLAMTVMVALYELVLALLARSDLVLAALRIEVVPLGLALLAVVLRVALLAIVPAWALYVTVVTVIERIRDQRGDG